MHGWLHCQRPRGLCRTRSLTPTIHLQYSCHATTLTRALLDHHIHEQGCKYVLQVGEVSLPIYLRHSLCVASHTRTYYFWEKRRDHLLDGHPLLAKNNPFLCGLASSSRQCITQEQEVTLLQPESEALWHVHEGGGRSSLAMQCGWGSP